MRNCKYEYCVLSGEIDGDSHARSRHQQYQRGAVRWLVCGAGLPDSLASGAGIATWPRQASQSFSSGPDPDAWHA